ncbi:TniQ family protein [Methylobacterium sp. WL8]|uniref:TniQ family protein n=2 Tax=unclassified Methylobacterium TaxID=2615210 RepID=UPI00164FC1C9|nr:TniQ family protein [Methylobacterium sp. WL8]
MAHQNAAPLGLLRDDAEKCGYIGPAASPEVRHAELRIPDARLDRPNLQGSPDTIDPFSVITGKERKPIGQRHIVEAGGRVGASNPMTCREGRNPSAANTMGYVYDAGSVRSSWTYRKAPLRLRDYGAGEPAYSFIHRLASRNAYGVREFAGAYGLDFSAIVRGDRREVGRLSAVADVDAASLLDATPARVRAGIWVVRGERLMDQHIERGRDRICPACLAEDREAVPGEIGFGIRRRVWWDLNFLHRCPTHGMPLRGMRSEALVDLKGTADAAPESGCGWEAYVLGRLGFTQRTDAQLLDQLSLKAAVDMVATCGAVAVHGAGLKLQSLHIGRDAEAMRTGFRVARSDDSFIAFLRHLRHEEVDGSMSGAFGILNARFSNTRTKKEPVANLMKRFEAAEKLRQELRRHSAETMGKSFEKGRGKDHFWISAAKIYLDFNSDRIPITARPETGSISLSRALRSKIGPMRIFEAILDGRLLPKCQVRSFSGIRSIFVSRADIRNIEALKEKTKPELTAEVFGRRLNMHAKSIRKLVSHGIIHKTNRKANRCYIIEESEFEMFVQTYVTARVIGFALGMQASMIRNMLKKRYGIEPILPNEAWLSLFRRADLLRSGLPAPKMQLVSDD